ncbi:MAG TPA: DUF411 domain-containing protein [Nitrosomonas sp.]|nr:DUF411 domain-containing protein [Nitrosomonas sp.]HMW20683.1 DUF411 domain-containing protein [Nitrosomonas sp.]HMY61390.1 DUF411 domain-containing protein [Nitrosomonas sp.]HMY89083.1 DUF411 domain-containing protein [Nitrosomonas sp.]HNA69693.1 DUF411 domain-containing protein [Nitrosomonas sp.]
MKTNKRQFILTSILTIHLVITTNFVSAAGTVEVYKSPTCGCCGKWVDHLRDHGFTVNTHDVGNKEARARAGISPTLGSCHTALVDGYAIEGHVPAQDIIRLLKERPKAVGISVPDMPHGTPGMEGERNDPYDVLLIQEKGDTRDKASVFNRYRP